MSSVISKVDISGNLIESATLNINGEMSANSLPAGYTADNVGEMIIGSNVTSIARRGFADFTKLTKVTIGHKVSSIVNEAFHHCSSLTDLIFSGVGDVDNPSELVTIGNDVFYGCPIKDVTIPASVTSIGQVAFTYPSGTQSQLETLTFESGSNLTTIGHNAFKNSKITSIELPNTVTNIAYNAFYKSTLLTNFTFQSGSVITELGNGIFNQCYALTSIEIPKSVVTIGNQCFYECLSLASVTFETPSSLESITGSLAFGETSLTSFTFPDSVKSIGSEVFRDWNVGKVGTSDVDAVTLPRVQTIEFGENSAIESIANNAFSGCNGLTKVTMYEDSVDAVGVTSGVKSQFGSPSTTLWELIFEPRCFPPGTLVTTDDGEVCIENLCGHRIRGSKVLKLSRSYGQDSLVHLTPGCLCSNVPSVDTLISREHRVYYKGDMMKARDLVGRVRGVVMEEHDGSVLYNVVLGHHGVMKINNLICETHVPRAVRKQHA